MIPKIIHLYWHDKKKLPYIVKKCIKNIKEKNKDFTVKLYDKKFIMSKLTNIIPQGLIQSFINSINPKLLANIPKMVPSTIPIIIFQ